MAGIPCTGQSRQSEAHAGQLRGGGAISISSTAAGPVITAAVTLSRIVVVVTMTTVVMMQTSNIAITSAMLHSHLQQFVNVEAAAAPPRAPNPVRQRERRAGLAAAAAAAAVAQARQVGDREPGQVKGNASQ